MACASQHQRGLKRVPRFPCTWGKSPGELPDWKRVGPAKAAEMLGPAITQEADAGLHARGFAPRTAALHEPARTLEQGSEAAGRRGRHLPLRGLDHQADRGRAAGAE